MKVKFCRLEIRKKNKDNRSKIIIGRVPSKISLKFFVENPTDEFE